LGEAGQVRRPHVPACCDHNAHMYYLRLNDLAARTRFIQIMKDQGVQCVFHYVPLHSSPFGLEHGRADGHLAQTEIVADQLVRLPLWLGMNKHQPMIVDAVLAAAASAQPEAAS
jgi:dTDP-4-amino-4,6-dideoxygalactose transaminase